MRRLLLILGFLSAQFLVKAYPQTGAEQMNRYLPLLRGKRAAIRPFPDKDHFFNGNGSGFDRLAGGSTLRQQICDGISEEAIRKSWVPALTHFKAIRKKYLLYAE